MGIGDTAANEGDKVLPSRGHSFGPGLEQINVREWDDGKEIGLDAEEEGLLTAIGVCFCCGAEKVGCQL